MPYLAQGTGLRSSIRSHARKYTTAGEFRRPQWESQPRARYFSYLADSHRLIERVSIPSRLNRCRTEVRQGWSRPTAHPNRVWKNRLSVQSHVGLNCIQLGPAYGTTRII